ncbi:hypothetical protein Syun_031958 [Stephania yunnanensis]|uniref:Uncharacterized protein n=1 Tax=Stephania yunnanensis TaxID=152371 RepID=A0AAP0E428_9MAGN
MGSSNAVYKKRKGCFQNHPFQPLTEPSSCLDPPNGSTPSRVSVHSSFPVGEASEQAVGAEANSPSFGFDPSVTREGLEPSDFDYLSSVPMPGGISNPGFSAMVSRQDSELSITHVYTCEPTNRQIEPVDTALLNYFDGLERLNPDPGDSHELLLNKASRLIEHYLEFFYLSLPESHTSLDVARHLES